MSPLRRGLVLALSLTCFAAPAAAAPCPTEVDGDPVVALATDLGTICIQLFATLAPLTVVNFLGYVERGDYDGTFIHRSVPGFVIQGGGFRASDYEPIFDETSPTVDNEPDCDGVLPERCNLRGTVAMAKGGDPDSAVSQWFINLADNGGRENSVSIGLDSPLNAGGFTVFGQVIAGTMAVADAVAALPVYDLIFNIDSPQRDIFSQTPLLSDLEEDPQGYGCFVPGQTGALVNLAGTQFENDPVTGRPYYWISYNCIEVPASGTCTDPNRIIIVPPSTQLVMTCDEIEASELSLAARRADLAPQVAERLFTVIQVPESDAPGAALLVLAGLAARRMRRNDQRAPDSLRRSTRVAAPS